MADRIKGITVEIGGDTTGLSKALSGVNKEIKSTQAQLKDVNSLLKLDPSNAELLSQKQRLLSQAVEETKGKLTELKAVQDQMDEGLKNGSVTQQQYDAWKREIIATEEELKNLETQTKNTDSAISATLKEAGSKVSAVGDKISGVGETMTKNVTAPIAAVGAASLAAFSEVDEGMDIIVTKTGATGEALESMENIAKDIATTIPTSFADAGTAVGEVNTRFGLTGKALQDLSTQFIEFASINNTDVNTSIGNTQMILSQFGMGASEAGNVLGLLTSVSQKTGISVDDLSNLLQQNGATFKEMGLGVGEAITLMGNFEKAGIDSASMLTGLKKAASNYSKDGKSMEEGLGDLIKRLQDSSTAADATAEAYSLFGTKGGLAFVTAAKEGRISLDGLSTDLSSFSTTVSDTYEGTLDGIDSATTAMNSLKEAGAAVGEVLGDTLAPILQSVAAGLKSFAQWFSNLSPGMKDMIVKIALIAAAVGPVLIIIGKVVSAIGSIISAAGAISGVISAIAGALPALGSVIAALTGPIGIVLVLIELIVDVLELDCFCVIIVGHTADTVGEHLLERDAVLRRLSFFVRLLRPCDGGIDLAAFGTGQRIVKMCLSSVSFFAFSLQQLFDELEQSGSPPHPVDIAASGRHKNYWSDMAVVSGAGTAPGRCCGRSFPAAVRFFHTRPAEKTAA